MTKGGLESKLNALVSLWFQGFNEGAEILASIFPSLESPQLMICKIFLIRNKFGLHARPSASFVQTASGFQSEIQVEKDGQVADGKSIIDLMMLAAAQGTYITVKAQGEDAPQALTALGTLIEGQFGEE